MRYYMIPVLITALSACLISCKDSIGKQHDPVPKENTVPIRKQKRELDPRQKDTISKPLRKPKDRKNKKKKASDTLKPKLALHKSA